MRALGRESAAVVVALQDRQERQEEQEHALLRRAQAAHKQDLTAKRIRAEIHAANEELKRKSHRWLNIKGQPGSGKSALLLEMAVRSARKGAASARRMPHWDQPLWVQVPDPGVCQRGAHRRGHARGCPEV